MSVALAEPIRDARLQAIADAIDAAGAGATLTLYGGAQPDPGAATSATALAIFTLPHPVGSVTAAVLTLADVAETQAVADGTATWGRIVDAAGTWAVDLDAGPEGSGAAIELSDTQLYTGGVVKVLSGELLE
ncbi:hypothetical protein [Arhodomonas sp. AD133]|uniref:hypothetical protein n=1 Tax=Arhodomonas sp. AD133 TaxID=3415009 RepID=UPI003EB8D6E3